ncbi:MAG: OpgC domain-containing protein [Geminicoccaceae bacterium]
MFIIPIAHVPWNSRANYIPARFGFSDATEIFVFCSGMASAIAFGWIFDAHGLLVGTGRILLRVWQIYWAHLAVFVVIAGLMVAAGVLPDDMTYVDALHRGPFSANPMAGVLGLVTLTYVPNYFDILPMYLVILTMVSPVMGALLNNAVRGDRSRDRALARCDLRDARSAGGTLAGPAQVFLTPSPSSACSLPASPLGRS